MLIRFVDRNDKVSYVEVKEETTIEKLMQSKSKHIFLLKGDRKYEYTGNPDGIHTFKEADIIELKLKQYASKLIRANRILLAAGLLDANLSDNEEAIEEFIKSVGIQKNSTKLDQIRELKKKPTLYPKDEAHIKVLWWEAKRDALRDKMQRLNLELPTSSQQSFLTKVVNELNSRITKAIKYYKNFPEVKAGLDVDKLFKIAQTTGTFFTSNDPSWRIVMERFSGHSLLGLEKPLENALKIWTDFSDKYVHDSKDLTIEDIESIYNQMSNSMSSASKAYNRFTSQVSQLKDLLDDLKMIKSNIEENDVFLVETFIEKYKNNGIAKFEPQKLKFMDKEVQKHLQEIRHTKEFALWLTGEGKYREMAEKLK